MNRFIARLDVKGRRLIKGVQYEGVRVLGDALEFAERYYDQGADEILYIDSVASLYGRPSMGDLLIDTVASVFVPVTAGGGVTTLGDFESLLQSGADKIAVNTGAIRNPDLIAEASRQFGSQCVVVSIQAKRKADSNWEAYIECGREKTGVDVLEWVQQVQDLGAGEILLTSIDRDGTQKGCDIELFEAVKPLSTVPIVASGGISSKKDVDVIFENDLAEAVAIGKSLHDGTSSITQLKAA